jgi:hypothetical protein
VTTDGPPWWQAAGEFQQDDLAKDGLKTRNQQNTEATIGRAGGTAIVGGSNEWNRQFDRNV